MHEVTDILTTLIVSLYNINVHQNAKLYPTNMYNYNVSFEKIKKINKMVTTSLSGITFL